MVNIFICTGYGAFDFFVIGFVLHNKGMRRCTIFHNKFATEHRGLREIRKNIRIQEPMNSRMWIGPIDWRSGQALRGKLVLRWTPDHVGND